jgi:hypothetical protein
VGQFCSRAELLPCSRWFLSIGTAVLAVQPRGEDSQSQQRSSEASAPANVAA